MPVIRRLQQKKPSDPEFHFHCPGCGFGHWFKTTGTEPKWTWNEDFDKPTVRASIRVQSSILCHLFITDGNIQFLDDCTHDLAGKTVPMVDQ